MKQAGFATFSVRLLKKCEIWLQHTAKKSKSSSVKNDVIVQLSSVLIQQCQ